MRILSISIFCLCYLLPSFAQQKFSFPDFQEAPLKEVLLYLEANHQLLFSYRDNNIQTQQISLTAGEYELDQYLNQLFAQTALRFEFIDDQHIILSQATRANQPPGYYCAYLKDRNSQQALPLAVVEIKNQNRGVNASAAGWFELYDLTEQDTLIVHYVGYQQLEIPIEFSSGVACPDFYLNIEPKIIPTIEITEYLTDGISQRAASQAIVISPDRLSALPGAVEPDVMSSIQVLPGIFSPDETASGVYIRGGTPDQNLVLWDGVPIYHTGHFFGMISAFNPYLVETVEVYRSGMGAEFGGRVSGVIDIKSNDNPSDQFNISAGFNMTHWHLNSSIPLWKKSSFSLSFRRSFTDSWASPTFLRYAEKVFQGSKLEAREFGDNGIEDSDKFYFGDANLKWVWTPGKNQFGVQLFGGENQLNYVSELPQFNAFSRDTLSLTNGGGSIFWKRDWSTQFSSHLQLTVSDYDYNYQLTFRLRDSLNQKLFQFDSQNTIFDESVNLINEWRPAENHQLKFGYQYTKNEIGLGLRQEVGEEVGFESTTFTNRLHTVFGEYRLFLADILDFKLGLRYQRQSVIKNDYFEPRIAIHARVNDQLQLKLSSGKQFQFVSQLILLDVNDIGINNQIWIASDNVNIPVIESNQWTGGLLFTQNDWTLDLEGYVKELAGITTLSNSFGNLPDQPFSKGTSRIRGIDLLLKKRFPNYRTWMSYTLSKAVYEFTDLQETVFPAAHDQRHALQWVHLFEYKNWEVSLGWQFRTGLPFTEPREVQVFFNEETQENTPFIAYGEQSAQRLRPYHRLDASIMYHWAMGKRGKGFLGLSFLNLYNTANLLERRFLIEQYDEATQEAEILELNTVGLRFTPNVVLRWQW
ncbi:MAG: TonB-dependent receptor [Bacteroidota bacterium]